MAKYLFVYYGGKMETDPKKQAKSMEVWMKWFGSLGKAVVDAGAPAMPGKMVSGSGVRNPAAPRAVTGYTLIQAANMDAAVKIAKSSPQITSEGQIGVYELAPM
jgi:hypothetical protein